MITGLQICTAWSVGKHNSRCKLQRRLLIGSGALGVAAVTAYSDDLTDLQFDAATAAGHLLKLLDAESAHAFGIWAAKRGLVPRERRPDPPCLRTAVWGRTFKNPIGGSPLSLLLSHFFETRQVYGAALPLALHEQRRPNLLCLRTAVWGCTLRNPIGSFHVAPFTSFSTDAALCQGQWRVSGGRMRPVRTAHMAPHLPF